MPISSYKPLNMFSKYILSIIGFISIPALLVSQVLEVGPGKTFGSLSEAAQIAEPGDTIMVFPDNYTGGQYISELQGTPNNWITIRGIGNQPVTITGGTNALQFSDPEYVVLEHFRFTQQTGNGLNIDDGGTYVSPAKHLLIRDCHFENMAASGNNDFLKLSGLDSFVVEQCTFNNGAAGGSGIDMVGCHWGIIRNNTFENQGSNSIQAKGGTRFLEIYANSFLNGGQRTLNLGGSTGSAFFRPPGANYEAADLNVYSNLIQGSWAAIAYVGSQRVRVWNNTIYQPQNWVIRILQESSDTSFYQAVSQGEFINNIVVVTSSLSTTTNVGPYTNAASFTFANNLWFHQNQSNWTGPTLPAPQSNGIIQMDPQFLDDDMGDFRLEVASPAIGKGKSLFKSNINDYDGKPFLDPPSIGAFEGGMNSSIEDKTFDESIQLYPNPAADYVRYNGPAANEIQILDFSGKLIRCIPSGNQFIPLNGLQPGLYQILFQYPQSRKAISLVIQ